MKRPTIVIVSLAAVFCLIGIAGATPIAFDLAGAPKSSVQVIDSNTGWLVNGDITASLASNLDSQTFTLGDGESRTVDFFSLTVSGLSLFEDYSVQATLGFDEPNLDASVGSGGGTFFSFWGIFSGGTLSWDPGTLPDLFIIGGNTVSVNFENGCTIGWGDTAMVHATISNLGCGVEPGAAPVPEPATMLLLGTGLAGLAAVSRRKAGKD